jgi:hypothetical protein
VALTDQQMGEAREGLAGGRKEWRARADAVTTAIVQWLDSNDKAANQAIRLEQEGHVPSHGNQNREQLAAMVESTRVSTTMAAESASRCKVEQQTLLDLRAKLQDT